MKLIKTNDTTLRLNDFPFDGVKDLQETIVKEIIPTLTINNKPVKVEKLKSFHKDGKDLILILSLIEEELQLHQS